MTIDSPKGPESKPAYEPGARDRVARWYRDQWGYRVNNEATLRHADDALEAVRPELERLTAEVERQNQLAGGWWQQSQENGRSAESLRAEVSRLREQLATAVVLPQDAEDQLRIAIADPGSRLPRIHYTPERASEPVTRWSARSVLDLLGSWSAPVSESVPVTPQQAGEWCEKCNTHVTGSHYHCGKCGQRSSMMGHSFRPCPTSPESLRASAPSEASPEEPFEVWTESETVVPTDGIEHVPATPASSMPPAGGDSDTTPRVWTVDDPHEPPDWVVALAQPPGSYWKYLIRGTKSGWYFSNSLAPRTTIGDASGWGWAFSRAELPLTQVTQVSDVHGDVWTWVPGTHEWSSPETQNCAWSYMAKKWSPLTEVLPSPSSLPQEGGTDDSAS